MRLAKEREKEKREVFRHPVFGIVPWVAKRIKRARTKEEQEEQEEQEDIKAWTVSVKPAEERWGEELIMGMKGRRPDQTQQQNGSKSQQE